MSQELTTDRIEQHPVTAENHDDQRPLVEKRFPKEAITQAKAIATQQQPDGNRPEVQGFTIDGPTSLDLDDAIWLEETDTGATLSVHISDASEYIPKDSPR